MAATLNSPPLIDQWVNIWGQPTVVKPLGWGWGNSVINASGLTNWGGWNMQAASNTVGDCVSHKVARPKMFFESIQRSWIGEKAKRGTLNKRREPQGDIIMQGVELDANGSPMGPNSKRVIRTVDGRVIYQQI